MTLTDTVNVLPRRQHVDLAWRHVYVTVVSLMCVEASIYRVAHEYITQSSEDGDAEIPLQEET